MIPLKKPLPEPQPENQMPQSSQSTPSSPSTLKTPSSQADITLSTPAVTPTASRKSVTTFIIVMVVIIGLALGIYFLFVKEKKSGWEDDLNEWDTEYVDSYYEDY